MKLWVHESERIYGDRLVNAANLATYKAAAFEICGKSFAKFNLKKYFGPTPEPLIFAQFVGGLDDKTYDQFPSLEARHLTIAQRDALQYQQSGLGYVVKSLESHELLPERTSANAILDEQILVVVPEFLDCKQPC